MRQRAVGTQEASGDVARHGLRVALAGVTLAATAGRLHIQAVAPVQDGMDLGR